MNSDHIQLNDECNNRWQGFASLTQSSRLAHLYLLILKTNPYFKCTYLYALNCMYSLLTFPPYSRHHFWHGHPIHVQSSQQYITALLHRKEAGRGSCRHLWNGRGFTQQVSNDQHSREGKQNMHDANIFFFRFVHRFGINGRACILKLICELAETRGLPYNGLLGKAFETIFL